MFFSEVEVKKIGNRLHIYYYKDSVIVEEVLSDKQAYDYCITQARTLADLRSNLLREAEKFNKPE